MATSDTQNILNRLLEAYKEQENRFIELERKISDNQLQTERQLSQIKDTFGDSIRRLHTVQEKDFVSKQQLEQEIKNRYSHIFITRDEMDRRSKYLIYIVFTIIGIAVTVIEIFVK